MQFTDEQLDDNNSLVFLKTRVNVDENWSNESDCENQLIQETDFQILGSYALLAVGLRTCNNK